jgi:hypothetical protein
MGRLLLTSPIDVVYFATKFAGAGTRTADEQGIFSAYCFLGQRKYPNEKLVEEFQIREV